MSTLIEQNRYDRQNVVFSDSEREKSVIQSLGGDANPIFTRALTTGAAGAGVDIGSDFHGHCGENSHFLSGPIPQMVEKINPEVTYHYIDTFAVAADCKPVVSGRSNCWTAVPINDTIITRQVLEELNAARIRTRVLLWQTGPGGVLVERCSSPAVALDRLETVPDWDEMPAGPPELGIMAAGGVLSEVMNPQAMELDDLPSFRTTMIYSFHRRNRVTSDSQRASLGDLAREIAETPAGQQTIDLSDSELVVVGAGALGEWFLLGPAWAGEGLKVAIYDKDPKIELHNVSRQPLVCRSIGSHPKAQVVASELQLLDPQGQYEAVFRSVLSPDDIDVRSSTSAILALPDSDAARAVSGDRALAAGLSFGTAGSSVSGAQSVICDPRRGACVRCLLGLDGSDSESAGGSCDLQEGSVVGTNMVGAAIVLAELRRTLSGLPFANVAFTTTGREGNRLTRMVSHPPDCEHVEKAEIEMSKMASL